MAELGWVSPSDAKVEEIDAVMSIVREGDQAFLRASHDRREGRPDVPAVHFGKGWKNDKATPLDQACQLSWRWRPIAFPKNNEDAWLDLSASVYVIVELPGIISRGQGFKFGWLQKDVKAEERQMGLYQLALQTKVPSDGGWVEESVDLCALYKKHYGEDPSEKKLLYVGVVTDADNTASLSVADYDDFVVKGVAKP